MDSALQRAVSKAGWRFIPLLVATYVLNYLDRNCIGFAALKMNHDIGVSASQFGFGAGAFFLSYCVCQLPSNALLYKVGGRRWLARIMISWGIASAATAFVYSATSFYIVRFLLGVAEAGYFPGVIYFLGTWFPPQQRARYVALMLLGIPISSVIGGPICGWLLRMEGIWGLAGWKWMFLVLSLPCVLLGIAALRRLTDNPDRAAWLTDEERDALKSALSTEVRERAKHAFWGALADPRVLILTGVQFGFTLGSYAIGIWLPLILKQFKLPDLTIGFLTSVAYLIASVAMLLWAAQVDKRGHKILNVVAACVLAGAGLIWAVKAHQSLLLSMSAITIALIGVNAARSVFWTIPTRFLVGAGAAGGVAFIDSIGTIGGFVGPFMMGWLKSATGSFEVGIGVLAGIMFLTAALAWSLKLVIQRD